MSWGWLLNLDILVDKANVQTYIWSISENLENSRKLILWWEDSILAVEMSNKSEKKFTSFLVQGRLLKLDITVHKANVLMYIWSLSENLEISRKLILWWEDYILVVDMSNENENNFTLFLVQGGLLKLDIMLRKAKVLTYIWSFSENLENSRKLIYDEKIFLTVNMSNKNENNFTFFLVQGGYWNLISCFTKLMYWHIWSFSENLENSRKLILWWEDFILAVDIVK